MTQDDDKDEESFMEMAGWKVRGWLAFPLLWIGNWGFIRPAERLLKIEKRTGSGDLLLALLRNEQIETYGIEGLALIKQFHDTYLLEGGVEKHEQDSD